MIAALGRGAREAHDRLGRLQGWRLWAVLAAAGAFSALAMAPFFVFPALILGLTLLVWALDGARRSPRQIRSGALRAYAFAMGYFLAGTFWVGVAFWSRGWGYVPLIPVALPLFCTLLAVFWAGAGAAYAALLRRLPGGAAPWRGLLLAALLAGFEWLRGHVFSGLPWNLAGYAWPAGGAMSQTAALVGVYGLTLFSLILAAAPAGLVGAGRLMARAAPCVLAALLGGLLYGHGAARLAAPAPGDQEGVLLRLVQTDISQREKWAPENYPMVVRRYVELTAAPGLDRVSHVLWPEGALPTLLLEDRAAQAAIASVLDDGPPLLTGLTRRDAGPDGSERYYNSLGVLRFSGGELSPDPLLYDKVWLVPFGEYMPGHQLIDRLGVPTLSRLSASFTAGPGARRLNLEGAPSMAPLICYEAIFPHFVASAPERADWLFNLSNDAWFGATTGPRQHLNQALYRSIETGSPMVRSASRGVSGVSDSFGRLQVRIEPRAEGAYDVALPRPVDPPFYQRAGDLPFFLILLTILSIFLAAAGNVHAIIIRRHAKD